MNILDLKGIHSGVIGIVIGNGNSRKGFDLENIPDHVVTIGCNAVYRDYTPNYLVSRDTDMIEEILRIGYSFYLLSPMEVYRRALSRLDDYPTSYLYHVEIPDKYGCSGNSAIAAAACMGCDPIFLLGFDCRTMDDRGDQNNVYIGTKNYQRRYGVDRVVSEWVEGFESVRRDYPKTEIVQVGTSIYRCSSVSWDRFTTIVG